MANENHTRKTTLDDLIRINESRAREEKEIVDEAAKESLKFLRATISEHTAIRHHAEVNFTQLLDSHWYQVKKYPAVAEILGGYSLNPHANQMTMEEIEQSIDGITRMIDDENKMSRGFIDLLNSLDRDKFRSMPWTAVYRFMCKHNLHMIQCMITQVFWKKLSLEYHQYRSTLNTEQARIDEMKTLDPLGISDEIRKVVKRMKELKKEMMPIEIQYYKYKEKFDKLNMEIAQVEMESEILKNRLKELPETQRLTTLEQVSAKRGFTLKMGDFSL